MCPPPFFTALFTGMILMGGSRTLGWKVVASLVNQLVTVYNQMISKQYTVVRDILKNACDFFKMINQFLTEIMTTLDNSHFSKTFSVDSTNVVYGN